MLCTAVLEFSEVLTDDVAYQFSWIDYKCFHHISSSLRFHLIWTLHWKKQLTQKLLKVRHIRHREEVTCDARDNGRLGSKALFSSQIALHVWGIQNGGRPSSGQGSLSVCLHTVHSHKKFFLIVWSRMWLIFECDIFYSCFDSWIARFNIATETVSVLLSICQVWTLKFQILRILALRCHLRNSLSSPYLKWQRVVSCLK